MGKSANMPEALEVAVVVSVAETMDSRHWACPMPFFEELFEWGFGYVSACVVYERLEWEKISLPAVCTHYSIL